MVSKESALLKNTLLFSVGNMGAKVLMLIIVPIYSFYVSVEQMGQYDLLNTYASLFAPISCMGIYEGIYRWLLDSKISKGTVIKNGYIITAICLAIFDVIAVIVLNKIRFEFIWEIILLINVSALYSTVQFTTRGLRNNRLYAVQGIIYSVIMVLAICVFVIWQKMQARGLMLSMITAYSGTSLFLIITQRIPSMCFRSDKGIDYNQINHFLRYSAPMVPNSIAWWMVSASNRVIINMNIGDAANGIFAVANKFPSIVAMLSTFFYQAWQEQAISEYNSEERDSYYTSIFNLYVRILFSLVIVAIPATKLIIMYFMDSQYSEAWRYSGLLYLAGVVNAFAGFYGTGFLSVKKTRGALTSTILGAVVNILITCALISGTGLYAACLGSLIGNAAIWIYRIFQTRKLFTIRIDAPAFAKFFGLSLLAMGLLNFVEGWLLFGFTCAVGILICAMNRDILRKMLVKVAAAARRAN